MIYFTVGPSQIYPTVKRHINEALKTDILSLNHRGAEFKKLYENTTLSLKKLLNIPKEYQVFFVSSALESMERTIQGCCEKCSFHIQTGSFGKSWAAYAQELSKTVITHVAKTGDGADLDRLYVPKNAELICVTQNDTSTGVFQPMEGIYELKKKYPEKLVAMDAVSSIPYIDIDYKYIDVTFFSVQKCFGLPPGLAVMIVSPGALAKAQALFRRGANIGSFHSFKNLFEKGKEFQTPETPNILNIYLLNNVIKDMAKVGLKKIRQDIDKKAKVLYEFFDHHKKYSPFIKNAKFRSPTTLVFDVKGESEKLRRKLKRHGFMVGAGYGNNKSEHIRIANFPSHKLKDVREMLKYI